MKLRHRRATERDLDLYHAWANDPAVRAQSFNQEPIPYTTHCAWFRRRLAAPDVLMLVFEDVETGEPVGQVRIEREGDRAVVGVSIASRYRGQGLAATILDLATREFHGQQPALVVRAYIRVDNAASRRAFEKAGYLQVAQQLVAGVPSLVLERFPERAPFPQST